MGVFGVAYRYRLVVETYVCCFTVTGAFIAQWEQSSFWCPKNGRVPGVAFNEYKLYRNNRYVAIHSRLAQYGVLNDETARK
jgi:hypothetical protein